MRNELLAFPLPAQSSVDAPFLFPKDVRFFVNSPRNISLRLFSRREKKRDQWLSDYRQLTTMSSIQTYALEIHASNVTSAYWEGIEMLLTGCGIYIGLLCLEFSIFSGHPVIMYHPYSVLNLILTTYIVFAVAFWIFDLKKFILITMTNILTSSVCLLFY